MCAEKFHTCGGPRRRPGLGEGRGRRMYHVCTILYIYILIHTVYITIYIQNPERERESESERERERYIYRDTYTQTQTYIIYIPTFGPLDWPSTIFFFERPSVLEPGSFRTLRLCLPVGTSGPKLHWLHCLVFSHTALPLIGDSLGI